MADRFYCSGCGSWMPLSERGERAGKRPKCPCCEWRARKLDAISSQRKDGHRRPAAKSKATFLHWASHV